MSELAKLMVRSGILKENQIEQFKHWGMQGLEGKGEPLESVKEFLSEVELALQQQELVLVRETDFSALHDFLKKQHQGVLHLETGTTSSDVHVAYTVSKTGEYIMPWAGENVSDLLANGQTHLVPEEGGAVYFCEVRELFYGQQKAFVVCRPSPSEPLNIDHKDPLPPALSNGDANGTGSHTPQAGSQE